ncbi:adenylate cyclase type 10-like [Prorops nasuta]|uniref:adenylate cyclase type 10-like n=1 Tax=Prorops nasuta TaxID=863751 RepID=UPI0034CE83B3
MSRKDKSKSQKVYCSNGDEKPFNSKDAQIEEHTKIFASMCPDEILDHYNDYQTRVYNTTLMLGDVSGFTDLSERYTKAGRGGPSKLTETLNSYIGAMVQEILSQNGDVLKFSGDAFIVMWKLQEGMVMRDIAVKAIHTACVIQKHFGSYETDVGVTLKVKLAIASGKIYFTSIGDPKSMSYYLITGKTVWDVKAAEHLCRGGDILVAPSSWQWANPNEYIYTTLPDGLHTLIISSSVQSYQSNMYEFPDPSESTKLSSTFRTERFPHLSLSTQPSTVELDNQVRAAMIDLTGKDPNINKSFKQVDYSLRPKVIKAANDGLEDALKTYILRPVIRSVEKDEPIEYLTEMRQVVILFINVITDSVAKQQLVSLVNTAYNFICSIVGSMHGCVNKTSLFDKDLMFLCIFGLRGDKHELESQIGLRCASKVRAGLISMKNILSVSIGVTTGVTYCGVVGHILRREYTVIGMSVNKAARLMCAYTDQVTCDRESFLHSHLEAKHFILQEPRPLKGLKNIGPVYEFLEDARYRVSELVWSKYPLLGREDEMNIFWKMLNDLLEHQKTGRLIKKPPVYNTLIIKGEPRMGKTRLLDEIAQNIPEGIPCNYISLISGDKKVPYTLIHLIFSMPLGFSQRTTAKEREDKIIVVLGPIKEPDYLCSLNQAFKVRFRISEKYRALTKENRDIVLRKFLMKLLKNCFKELWIVIIDDLEYSDFETIRLFDTLTKADRILFLVSVGKNQDMEYKLHSALLLKAKLIELIGIDKWYHAGLACQILNVKGIPAELEKLIQEKSSGNPGWIESYLVSLVQAGGLVILNVTKQEAEEMGYVLPPNNMLDRSESDTALQETNNIKLRMDSWKMYETSFKDSSLSLFEHGGPSGSRRTSKNFEESIAICKIPNTYILEDAAPEMTMDVIILKMFDSLTPLEQWLLKSASVLGETIQRNMLESIMEDTTVKDIGRAVARLFETHVFRCAVGHFGPSRRPLMVHSQSKRSFSTDSEIRCDCTGQVIRQELADLPLYASCGMMRFKMTIFRDTTYGLLTETLKMELHSKALNYLQTNTRRCEACGKMPFNKLLGKKIKMHEIKKKNKLKVDIDHILDKPQFGSEALRKVSISSSINEVESENLQETCFSFFRKRERKETNAFLNVDFTNCTCDLILTSTYTQMLEHCRGLGRKDLVLTAILEFVQVCFSNSNLPQVAKLLEDAEVLLKTMFTSSEDILIMYPYLTGKVQTLQGRCFIECGLLSEAEVVLLNAIKILGYQFPKGDMMADIRSRIEYHELKTTLTCCRACRVGRAEGPAANYSDQLAIALSFLFDVYRAKGMLMQSRLAATWGLNAALTSSKSVSTLCMCYANMIITAHTFRDKKIISYLENESIVLCCEMQDTVELKELKLIADLYTGIFFSRWLNGKINAAIAIGFVSIRLSRTIASTVLQLIILPRLIHLLMVSCRLPEVVTMLRELEFVSNIDMDKSGYTWYYGLCADAQLDVGLTVLSFRRCEEYYLKEGESMLNLRDPEAQKRYFTSMWLWCIRNEEWEASKVWSTKTTLFACETDEQKVAASTTVLKRLEGLLILYVHKINTKDTTAYTILNEIKQTFKQINTMFGIIKIVLPRYYLLKAYYCMIFSQKHTALKFLRRSKKASLKYENLMIYKWAQHCENSWKGSIPAFKTDLWKERSGILPDLDEVNVNESTVISFTLPLPKYQ